MNKVISKLGVFDLRVLGFVHIVFYLYSILTILTAIRKLEIPFRSILAVLLIFIFCDVGYICYFNSFYTEPSTLIFLFFMLGFVLHLVCQKQPQFVILVLFSLFTTLFIWGKPQNSLLGFLLAIFVFRLSYVWRVKKWKYVSILCSLIICVSSILYYSSPPDSIKKTVLYNCIFFDLLPISPSPEEDLLDLGLKKELVSLKGTHPFMENGSINDPEFRKYFFSRIGYGKILKFYLTHPARLLQVMKRGAKRTFSLRPNYLGNFERLDGIAPRSQSQAFALWSHLKERYFPKSLWVISGAFCLNLLATIFLRLKVHATEKKLLLEVYLLITIMAIAQFFISIIGGGEWDLVKHLFLFNAFVDISIITMIMSGIWILTRLWQKVNRRQWQPLYSRPSFKISMVMIGMGMTLLLVSLIAGPVRVGKNSLFGRTKAASVLKQIGPTKTKAGKMFNVQFHGESAIWTITENARKQTVILWGETELYSTYGSPNNVTAMVPKSLYSKSGQFQIYLLDKETGSKSNSLIFTVEE